MKKTSKLGTSSKKTIIGHGKFSKYPTKGGGPNGSTISKTYRKNTEARASS